MTDGKQLIQETLSESGTNADPEYLRLLAAYCENPFYDLTKDSIAVYVTSQQESEEPKPL